MIYWKIAVLFLAIGQIACWIYLFIDKKEKFVGILKYAEKYENPVLVDKPNITKKQVDSMLAQIIKLHSTDDVEEILKTNEDKNDNS